MSAITSSAFTVSPGMSRCYFAPLPASVRSGDRELPEGFEVRDADTDEAKRAGTVAQRAVEQLAGHVADGFGIVDACGERRRAAADGEVGIAHLRRHGARALTTALQIAGHTEGHSAELGMERLEIDDIAFERLLLADRDAFDGELERPRIDPTGAVA